MMLLVISTLLLALPCQGVQLRSHKPQSWEKSEEKQWIIQNIGTRKVADHANDAEESPLTTASGKKVTGARALDIETEANLYICPRSIKIKLGNPDDCINEVRTNSGCGDIFAVRESNDGDGDSCVCCKPEPADVDCITCTAGKGRGWQVAAITGVGKEWTVKRLIANKPATCDDSSQHSWGAMQSYWQPALAPYMPYIQNYAFMLKSAAWTYTKSLVWTNQTAISTGSFDSDAIVLWQRGEDCMMVFRGSDSQEDFWNDWDHTPQNYLGLEAVSHGMIVEFEPLKELLLKELPKLEKTCTGKTSVVGHSLGGALMQMAAALFNHKDNPLETTLRVDSLYGWGPMPPAQYALTNHQSEDGCFGGGLHLDAVKASGDTPLQLDKGGTEGANPTPEGGPWMTWNKVKMYFLYGPGDFDELACGEPLPQPWTKLPTLSPWHDFNTYTDNMGCIVQ